MNRAFSTPGERVQQPEPVTAASARTPSGRWTLSQITLLIFVFFVFSLAGNPQLGLLEDLAGYLFLTAVVIESIRRGSINFKIPVEFQFAIGFVLWLLLTLCVEGLFVDSNLALVKLDRYFDFLQVFVLGLLIVAVLVRYGDIRPLEFAMYAGVIYSSVLMVNDLFLGGNLARAGGGIGQPNELGIGLAMASAFAFARLVLLSIDKGQKQRLDLLLVCGLLFIQALAAYMNFAWTGSRTGMVLCSLILAFSVGTLCYGVTQGKPRLLLLIVAVIVGFPFVIQAISDTTFAERLANVYLYFSGKELAIQEQSLFNRSGMFQTGLDLWWQRPIFGWGFDAFRYVSGYQTYSHSNYIELLTNNGIIGLGAYLAIFVVAMVRSITVTRNVENRKALRMMLFVLIGVLLASGVTSVIYYRKAHWIVLGLIVALIAMVPQLNRQRSATR